MDLNISARDVEYAENLLAAGDLETAKTVLEELVGVVEEWAAAEVADTSTRQWFAFDDVFERLAYRRVEQDPRTLVQVEAPLARIYAALAFVQIQREDFGAARESLMQAVRWNPMNCTYRLDLAEIFRALGDIQQWAAMSYSVIERASDGRSAGLAYANIGELFLQEKEIAAAAGAGRLALGLAPTEPRVMRLQNRLAAEDPELGNLEDAQVIDALAAQGIPTAPSAEIAICLLMCATDAAQAGDSAAATEYTVRAHKLVGAPAAKALTALIHETDAERSEGE
ncbi:hypothetical protein K6V98_01760 [Collinsella sp. AGMB00827]|uniref:Tetratricopeptide repeat protein n=1 Tax=Collinsella ureilytica TaxID=2869515 RepID=A0ABS7ML13_9ACTN|nr:hypothetical protein [Collinsella urealyticum]MBY4797090.1 hypothetical protein [Collinsella urealyticum]